MPPAQPIDNSSSSSVSRLRSISPSNILPSISLAPVIPVSSSMVNNASIAGCSISFDDNVAIIVATPILLSAPRVVPSASIQSPLTRI